MKNIANLGKELSRNIKTQHEMTEVIGELIKSMMEGILNAELDSHLGYKKNEKASQRRKNTRNGYGAKTLKTDYGDLAIQTPEIGMRRLNHRLCRKGKPV